MLINNRNTMEKSEQKDELSKMEHKINQLIDDVNELKAYIKKQEGNSKVKTSMWDCLSGCVDKCDENTIDKIEHGIESVVRKLT